MTVLANVLVIAVAVLFVVRVITVINRRRRGLVAERGMSIGADLGSLADQPVLRVRTVERVSTDEVRVVLAYEDPVTPDLTCTVSLQENEFADGQLRTWHESGAPLAVVMPQGSRLIRLRSVDDLQPVTLRRVDL